MSDTALADIDIAVLAGGLGTRLKPVLTDLPKILAPVEGRPFIEYLFQWLGEFGARRVVLCLGHLADRVRTYLAQNPPKLVVELSVEPEPLGTAGALRLARPLLRSDPVLVLNGDSFVDVDLAQFVAFHRTRGAAASLVCTEVDDAARFGRVETDASDRVLRFAEKMPQPQGPGLINGGIYLFGAPFLDAVANSDARSMEYDVLARQKAGVLHAFTGRFRFLDIGVPSALHSARASSLTRGQQPGAKKDLG